jgi:hypothetical protein
MSVFSTPVKKGHPPLYPAEKAVGTSLKKKILFFLILENDPPSFFIHL